MGIHISKNKKNTFDLYSTTTDQFLYKELTEKEVVFYLLDFGDDNFNIQNKFMRVKNTEDLFTRYLNYDDVKNIDFANSYLEGIRLFKIPLYLDDNQFVLIDLIFNTVDDKTITRHEAKVFFKDYYFDTFSDSYIERYLKITENTNWKLSIPSHIFSEDREAMFKQIEKLK